VRRAGLPSVDLAAFARVARRTAVVRAVLVLALAAALVAGAAAAREPDVEGVGLLAPGSSGVIVLDASASVEGSSRIAEVLPDLYVNPNRRIRAALQTLAGRDEPIGLVMFSDVAYELLPPGSPARTLAPLRRFFAPLQEALEAGEEQTFLENPWSRSFSGGTQISAGLSLALEMLQREAVQNGSILLLSDLDAPDDPLLDETLDRVRDSGVTVRIVSLLSERRYEEPFRRALGDDVFVDPGELERSLRSAPGLSQAPDSPRGASTLPIALLAVVVLLLLALHEHVLARLPLPRREAAP
jgi:hypothetical protein